ncbi:MAG: FlxA-like family protein [Lachnospiraceae bacterium]|nr:FlxA-like family protein [Lachnospiraceae bacterium]
MAIGNINGVNLRTAAFGMGQAVDSYSRNIQNQIADAQKQLQELSSNKDMTQEEKMTKRQEIQQQISDLNMQLRQHQMETRRQRQQKNGNFFDDMLGGSQNTGTAGSEDMGVLISLSTTKEQIADMKKVRTDLEGKLRTAETDEARESLQEKIDNLTEDIYEKVKETQDTIAENQKAEQDKAEDEKENETDVVLEEEQKE